MRIRTIKPDYFLDEDLDRLDERTQKLFQGLWCLADREGRLIDAPRRIKAQVFPYRDYDVDPMLEDLHAGCFIDRYEVAGFKCIAIRNFDRHQRPHPKEAAFGLPNPPPELKSREKKFLSTKLHVESPVASPLLSRGEGKGMDNGKGREFAGAVAAPAVESLAPPPSQAGSTSCAPESAGAPVDPPVRPPRRQARSAALPNPRHAPLLARLCEAYQQETGHQYAFDGGKDAKAVQKLASQGSVSDDEWERRWRIAIRDKYRGTKSLAMFASRPNDFVADTPTSSAARAKFDIRKDYVPAETQNHGPPGEHSF